MYRLILVSKSYERALGWMREHQPDRNPRGSDVIIITHRSQVSKLLGLRLTVHDSIVIESKPDRAYELLELLRILEKLRIPRPLENNNQRKKEPLNG